MVDLYFLPFWRVKDEIIGYFLTTCDGNLDVIIFFFELMDCSD